MLLYEQQHTTGCTRHDASVVRFTVRRGIYEQNVGRLFEVTDQLSELRTAEQLLRVGRNWPSGHDAEVREDLAGLERLICRHPAA